MAASPHGAAEAGAANAVEVVDFGRGAETASQRIQRLQREARLLAREQIETFARDLAQLAERAVEIAEGGEAYPVGARELASRLAEDLPQKSQTLALILNRIDHG
jgi:CRP-like cAMP-binding protein